MNRKIVSVIIPTYNSKKTIRKCVYSVCRQTYSDLEIVIIDDGSTDNTVEICDDLKHKDERIRVSCFENHGVSWARNKGISMANGEFIVFVDSDDWIDSRMVEKLMQQRDKADVVMCGIKMISATEGTKKLQTIEEDIYSIKKLTNVLNGKLNPFFGGVYNKLFRKEKIDLYNIRFQEGNSYGEDVCFCIDYYSICNSVYVITEGMYNYIINQPSSVTISNYNHMDYQDFWSQEMFLYDKYCSFMRKKEIAGDAILLGLWKVFISKVNKNRNISCKERIKIIVQFLRESEMRKKLYSLNFKNWKDKMHMYLLSNWVIIVILCVLLDIKHSLEENSEYIGI